VGGGVEGGWFLGVGGGVFWGGGVGGVGGGGCFLWGWWGGGGGAFSHFLWQVKRREDTFLGLLSIRAYHQSKNSCPLKDQPCAQQEVYVRRYGAKGGKIARKEKRNGPLIPLFAKKEEVHD